MPRRRKKRRSRKGKSAWKKNIDISDELRAIEDRRLDEKLNLSSKKDSDLFMVDTTRDLSNLTRKERMILKRDLLSWNEKSVLGVENDRTIKRKKQTKKKPSIHYSRMKRINDQKQLEKYLKLIELKKRQQMKNKKLEELRRKHYESKWIEGDMDFFKEKLKWKKREHEIDENIHKQFDEGTVVDSNNDNEEDPTKFNNIKNKRKKRFLQKIDKKEKDLDKGTLKELEKDPNNNSFDVWGMESNGYDDFVILSNRRKRVNKKKTILAGKMVYPEPGQSYNPEKQEHQDVLGMALAQLITIQDKDEEIKKRLSFPEHVKKIPKRLEVTLASDLVDVDDDDDEEEDELSNNNNNDKKKSKNESKKRLTVTDRNKIQKKKINKWLHKKQLIEKRKNEEIKRLPEIIEELKYRKEYLEEKQIMRDELNEEKKTQTKRLGKLPYKELPVDFAYTEEISSSLRKLPVKGNIASHLFNNYQRRNIIEPRQPTLLRRRYKKKSFVKNSFKFED